MNAKASRKKSTGKANKPLAVATSAGNTAEGILSGPANALPKWAEAILTQKDGHSDSAAPAALSDFERQLQFSRLEVHEARRLLEELEKNAQELSRLSTLALENVDALKLGLAISKFLGVLGSKSRFDGDDAEEAVSILLQVLRRGCALLTRLSNDEKSRETVKAVSSKEPKWPVMLSLKESSYQEAKKYLGDIGVGVASVPPTARTRIDATNRWTKCAVRLIRKIESSRETLEMQTRKEKSLSRFFLGGREKKDEFFEAKLAEARRWMRVLKLPRELNEETCDKWCAVAEAMLRADWKANPTAKDKLFKSVEKSAKSLIRTKRKDPAALARSLETESKNLIVKSIGEAFDAIAAKRKTA